MLLAHSLFVWINTLIILELCLVCNSKIWYLWLFQPMESHPLTLVVKIIIGLAKGIIYWHYYVQRLLRKHGVHPEFNNKYKKDSPDAELDSMSMTMDVMCTTIVPQYIIMLNCPTRMTTLVTMLSVLLHLPWPLVNWMDTSVYPLLRPTTRLHGGKITATRTPHCTGWPSTSYLSQVLYL